jgi:hypothetical protein
MHASTDEHDTLVKVALGELAMLISDQVVPFHTPAEGVVWPLANVWDPTATHESAARHETATNDPASGYVKPEGALTGWLRQRSAPLAAGTASSATTQTSMPTIARRRIHSASGDSVRPSPLSTPDINTSRSQKHNAIVRPLVSAVPWRRVSVNPGVPRLPKTHAPVKRESS